MFRHHVAERQDIFQQSDIRFELAQDRFVGQQLGKVIFIQSLFLHDFDGLSGEQLLYLFQPSGDGQHGAATASPVGEVVPYSLFIGIFAVV